MVGVIEYTWGKNVLCIKSDLYCLQTMILVKKLSCPWAQFYYSAFWEKKYEKKRRHAVLCDIQDKCVENVWKSEDWNILFSDCNIYYKMYLILIVCNIRYNIVYFSIPYYTLISVCFRMYFISRELLFWKMFTPGFWVSFTEKNEHLYHNDSLRDICLSVAYYKKQCLALILIKPMGFQHKPLAIKNAVYISRMLLKSKIVLHQ